MLLLLLRQCKEGRLGGLTPCPLPTRALNLAALYQQLLFVVLGGPPSVAVSLLLLLLIVVERSARICLEVAHRGLRLGDGMLGLAL